MKVKTNFPLPSSRIQRRVGWCWLLTSQVHIDPIFDGQAVQDGKQLRTCRSATQQTGSLKSRIIRFVVRLLLYVSTVGIIYMSLNSMAFHLRKIHRRKFRSVNYCTKEEELLKIVFDEFNDTSVPVHAGKRPLGGCGIDRW